MNKTVLTSFTILCLLSTVFLMGSKISVKGSSELTVHNVDTGLDYAKIQEAIDAPETLDGHTILVRSGIYYEHVVVNKSVSLIGDDKSTTIIDGNKTGNVVRMATEDVYLSNFTIRNSGPPPPSPWWTRGYSGIYLGGHSHNIIRDNTIISCYGGIEIVMSHNNTVENNHLLDNSDFGIRLHDSTENIINNNRIAGVSTAIFFDFGANRNRVNNNMISNTGFGIDINFNCANNTFKNNTISKCTFGISSYPCYNNIVTGNVISNCSSGIFLRGTNIITGNDVSYCEYGGVDIALSNFTVISGNFLTHNGMGIWVSKSDHNTIFENTLISNNHGFDVRHCANNTFYHNTVINNTIQAYLRNSVNKWDNGYPSGGNYWTNYTGPDECSGIFQNETGSDWIGDTPYVIDENNQDNYPLTDSYVPERQETRMAYRILLGEYNEILSDSNSLNLTYHTLLSNYSELQGNYTSLQISYNSLQGLYDSLNSTYTSLIGELNNIRNIMYTFMATTVILIATTVYFAKRKSKFE